ncbi:MAG: ABC transporter permease [bacterium]|nr:ABC transporter permease [bacterium]
MNFRAFATHFSFHFRTGMRNKTLLMMNYLLPLGFYGLMGFIMAEINLLFLETMIPAMVLFAILSATLLGVPDPLVTDREKGVFRSYKINGIPALSILAIPTLTTMLHMTVVSLIIALTAPVLFDAPAIANWPLFILVFLATAISYAGLSVLIGVISSSSRITVLWAQLIYLPSILLSGMMISYSLMPEVIQPFTRLFPATYAMYAFRDLGMNLPGDFNSVWSLLIMFAGGILSFIMAVYLFNWDSRNSSRRGHPVMAVIALLPYIFGIFFFL